MLHKPTVRARLGGRAGTRVSTGSAREELLNLVHCVTHWRSSTPEEDVWCLWCSSSSSCQPEREGNLSRAPGLSKLRFSLTHVENFVGGNFPTGRRAMPALFEREHGLFMFTFEFRTTDVMGKGKIPMGWVRKVRKMGSHTCTQLLWDQLLTVCCAV